MTEPMYSETTERVYSALPEFYRAADMLLNYPFKRWLSGIADRQGEVDTLLDRLDYIDPTDLDVVTDESSDTSDLADPDTADDAWLSWLGQLVGVSSIGSDLSLQERRDAIRYASSGWRAGTKLAVSDAAKSVLTGTKYAAVYDHSTSLVDKGTATIWDVVIVTRNSETPDPAVVLDAVLRKRAKPAGVLLHYQAYEGSWDLIEATYPTWDAIESTGNWDKLQETM